MPARVIRLMTVGLLAGGLMLIPGAQGVGTAQPMKYDQLNKIQKRLLSGFASSEVDQARGVTTANRGAAGARPMRPGAGGGAASFYLPNPTTGCAYRFGHNVNMDQDCQNVSDPDLSGRGQAQNETYISEDPLNRGSLLGSSNDYRRGDGHCFGRCGAGVGCEPPSDAQAEPTSAARAAGTRSMAILRQ